VGEYKGDNRSRVHSDICATANCDCLVVVVTVVEMLSIAKGMM
jgi:hypothetical protein